MNEGLAQSVHTRLIRHAKELGLDPNAVLVRYATERFLYRLSKSAYADEFVLKGALLLLAWLGEETRPTRDADLLRLGDSTDEVLLQIIREVCDADVEDDAMYFDRTSVEMQPIREEDEYGGRRLKIRSRLGNARLTVQVDIGIGDVVTPAADWLEYPSMLDLPRPRLRVYTAVTVLAEKAHAMVDLGAANSRMKDFFDVWLLSQQQSFDGRLLISAIRATFERRDTDIPSEPPMALTSEFAGTEGKQEQWSAFLKKNRLNSAPNNLSEVIENINGFLQPVLLTAVGSRVAPGTWPPGGPWNE